VYRRRRDAFFLEEAVLQRLLGVDGEPRVTSVEVPMIALMLRPSPS
jgi:hypothetical protein